MNPAVFCVINQGETHATELSLPLHVEMYSIILFKFIVGFKIRSAGIGYCRSIGFRESVAAARFANTHDQRKYTYSRSLQSRLPATEAPQHRFPAGPLWHTL